MIDGKPVNQHNSVKYLDIFIISKDVSRGIGVLCKIRHFVDVKILTQLYPAIILSFLSYSCLVWGNTNDHNIKLLQRTQKKAIRLITFSNFDAHTSHLFAQLNLLKLQNHIKLQALYFMHQFDWQITKDLRLIFLLKLQLSTMLILALLLGLPTIFQIFEQTMVN